MVPFANQHNERIRKEAAMSSETTSQYVDGIKVGETTTNTHPDGSSDTYVKDVHKGLLGEYTDPVAVVHNDGKGNTNTKYRK